MILDEIVDSEIDVWMSVGQVYEAVKKSSVLRSDYNIKWGSLIRRKVGGVSHWSGHGCRVKHVSFLEEVKCIFVLTGVQTDTVTKNFKT